MLPRSLRPMLAGLALALAGCPLVNDDRLDRIRDGDGDGLDDPRFGGADCDDADDQVGTPADAWPDLDGDGYGDAAAGAVPLCPGEARTGFAGNDLDCDDGDPTLNPDTPWYPDRDGDGWGDGAAEPTRTCRSDELVRDATDCDDADPDVRPDVPIAQEEPHDGVDVNCDGLTELDEDGDGYADLPSVACPRHRDVTAADQAQLLEALAHAEDCDDVVLTSDGPFGPVRIRAAVALRAAPGVRPVFAADAAEASALEVEARALTLEGLVFEGFEDAVTLPEGAALLGSRVEVHDGRAIVAPLRTSVRLYDSRFVGAGPVIEGAARAGPGPDEVHLERVEIALGVAPNTLLLGGLVRTTLTDVSLREVAALDALIRVPGGELALDRVSVTGSLGPALQAGIEGATLTDVVLRGNATVAPQLVFVHPAAPFALDRPTVAVAGLVVEDNAWTVQAPEEWTVFDRAAADYGLVVLRNVDLTLRSSRIVGNETPPLLSLLSAGDVVPDAPTVVDVQSTVLAGTWTPGDPLTEPSGAVGLSVFGPESSKRLSHLTFAHLRDYAVVTASELEVSDSVVTTVGAVFVDPREFVGELPGTSFSQLLRNSLQHDVGEIALCAQCPAPEPPEFVRDAPALDATLQDFHLRPGSPADEPGDADLGATGGEGSDGEAYGADVDTDGLPDGWEAAWCGGDCAPDEDGDGLDAAAEHAAGTLPRVADTDSDGRSDAEDPDPLTPR